MAQSQPQICNGVSKWFSLSTGLPWYVVAMVTRVVVAIVVVVDPSEISSAGYQLDLTETQPGKVGHSGTQEDTGGHRETQGYTEGHRWTQGDT